MKLCISILIIVTIIELKETLGKRRLGMKPKGKQFPFKQRFFEDNSDEELYPLYDYSLRSAANNKDQKEQDKNKIGGPDFGKPEKNAEANLQKGPDNSKGSYNQTSHKKDNNLVNVPVKEEKPKKDLIHKPDKTSSNNKGQKKQDKNKKNMTKDNKGKPKKKEKRKGDKIVLCQLLQRNFPNVEEYYFPTFFDTSLCSHLNLNFGVLDPKTLTLKAANRNESLNEQVFRKAKGLKNRGVKTIISLAPIAKAGQDKFVDVISSLGKRKNFVENAFKFLKTYRLSGLEIDWAYPRCSVDCGGTTAYVKLIKALRMKFKKEFILSMKVYPQNENLKARDLKELSKHIDYFVVVAYDYFNASHGKTDHVAPFYKSLSTNKKNTVDGTVLKFLGMGMPKKKLILGIPFHGNIFRLQSKSKNSFRSPTIGLQNDEYEYENEELMEMRKISYKEICIMVKHEGWISVNKFEKVGPYAYKDDWWISYDNVKQVLRKSNYVKSNGLQGVMSGLLDDDDNKDTCCCEAFPLIKSINRILSGYPKTNKKCF